MSTRSTRKRPRYEVGEDVEHMDPPVEDPGTSDSNMQVVEAKLEALKKDEEFWFDDGTVILVAGDIEFRVYVGLLSTHSPMLKDLFERQDHSRQTVSMPEGSNIRCAVVPLNDSPEDLRHLLRAYMPNHGAKFFTSGVPSYHAISASIRLGKKYGLTRLYDQALQYLKDNFPADFDGWNVLHQWVPAGFNIEHAIGVVNLARLTEELSILPTAFLACLALENGVVDGFVREDGTSEHLTLDDLGRCIRGQGSMRQASVAALLNVVPLAPSSTCKANCKIALRRIIQGLQKNVLELVAITAFAFLYDGFIPPGVKLCESCRSMVNDMHKREREIVWSRIPQHLDLEVPGWAPAEAPEVEGQAK